MRTLHIRVHQRLQIIVAGVFIDKESEEPTSDKPGSRGMGGQNAYSIFIIETARLAHKVYRQRAMLIRIVIGLIRPRTDMPAGEHRRAREDIWLGIVLHAHGEQLHEFTRVVLVGMFFGALGQIQVEEHGRIGGNAKQNIIKRVKSVGAQKNVLDNYGKIVLAPFAPEAYFAITAGQPAAPEEGPFLQ